MFKFIMRASFLPKDDDASIQLIRGYDAREGAELALQEPFQNFIIAFRS